MKRFSLMLLFVAPSVFVSQRTPVVLSVSPSVNSTSAARDAPIEITFDMPLDPSTVSRHSVSVFGRWSGERTGGLHVENDNNQIRFIPDKPFFAGELVTVSIAHSVASADGSPIGHGYAWSFWTKAESGSLDFVKISEVTSRLDGETHIQSYGAYAGDFDQDGFSDLAVPNELTDDVRIFLNDGRGNYASFTVLEIPGGSIPSPNEGADFNRDGAIDFVVGNAGNRFVSAFMGLGDGRFQFEGNFRADRAVRGVCVMDLNGDGFADVVTANQRGARRGNISILLNDGAGRFRPARTLRSPGRGEKTCAGDDFNGDGIFDVAFGAFGSQEVVVFLGDGNGGLTYADAYSAGGSPWMIGAGDVNGDGRSDIVAVNRLQDNMAVLIGKGDGTFVQPVTYPVGKEPLAVDLGDLDGDGDLDVVTSNFGSGDFTVYENAGDGTFGNPRTLQGSSAGSCAILHDRDNDGDLDVTGVDEIDDLIFLFENQGRAGGD